ncbi:non-ribosomal peptide synthetase [Nostoc sp. DedQUE09]|uniref:non-ribosomal peptide synthetase n=1 Tax=Nostoc sp. DedQUE09 TaxID=3075394 RepID=UPI002AD3AFBC|nr:non-ribosomal peptide synthetase [Nostoc sp. DedQUE09]MDZ7949845.1 amino acid adenylation domain-containing protein [Nostoc sp. DedQUE09]
MSLKNIEDAYPLSPMQQGMLFHSIYAPNSDVYVEQRCFELHGALNITAFSQAWQQVITRHPVLRTAYVWENLEKPLQVVCREVKFPWQQLDWREISRTEQQQRLETLLQAERQHGFLFSQAPLMRFTLIRLAEQVYQFCWSHHHLLLDGWSGSNVYEEVIAYYRAFCEGENLYLPVPRPYRDYIAWLQQQDISQAEAFWRKTLSGLTSPTQLGINPLIGYQPNQEQDYKAQELKLSPTTTAALNFFVKQYQLTLNTLVQAAWALLLSRYSGEEDILFGATVSGRPPALANAESMIGLFINTLPVRVQVSPKQELLSWLQQLFAQQVEARQYEYAPLVDIQKWSEISSNLSLFDSIVVFENYPLDETLAQPDLNFKIQNIQVFEKTNYPITLSVIPGRELLFKIAYQENDRFDAFSINQMLGHLQTLLEGMVANPYQRLEKLSLLTSAEQQQLGEWNNTQTEYPQERCIHELFEAQVKETPDAVAVVFENEQLTYCELNKRANQLAHYLRTLGVKPEVLVGICIERSLSMLIGLLAILKAGGAYIPLDPAYPKERLAFILEDAQVPLLLTQASLLSAMPQHQAQVICLDTDWQANSYKTALAIAQQSQENLFCELTPENLAYIIYTSGSTGKPKGVQIPHSALSNFLFAMKQKPGLTGEDTLLAVTTYSFDIAALELFLPIIVGGRLVIVSREVASDGMQLSATLANSKATVMQATPATWQLLLVTGWGGNDQLKILCGGEALPVHIANQLRQRCHSLWNMYGPTETTIWSAVSQIETDRKVVPIGHAIANTQFYILDQYSRLVPVGVAGELHIGGKGLARGYLNRPELTAEKFIPNPFQTSRRAGEQGSRGGKEDQPSNSERLYKTGDLARYLPNGEIEYIGRIDYQVKIRGFRIELGEIEAVISQHPAVRETVVVADAQRIVAYVVPHAEETLTISQLRNSLESKLPNYMVPAAFVILDQLPLTPNGKVDRKSLPVIGLTQLVPESSFVPPSTPIEQMLVSIWLRVLGIEKISIDDNFFEVGGHSLLATRLISQIRQVFQVELPLHCVFEKPTIAGLAKDIEKATKIGLGIDTPDIERISRSQELPLSFAQQRLWFLAKLDPNSCFYNIPAAVRLQGQLNIKALQQSFNEILCRHEALRANFQTIKGQPVAIISSVTSLPLSVFDISELPANQQEAQVKQQALAEAQQPFDLKSDLLLRVKLLRLSEQEHVVLFTMHHIVSDGWSIGVLVRELVALYQAFCDEQFSLQDATRTPLAELPVQYIDFAAWQREWLQKEALQSQLSYWVQQLQGAPRVLELPTDHPRPPVQTFRGATYSFELSNELSVALNKLSQQQGTTLFMTLLAAFQTLLWRYTSSEDIVVGSPIANRNRAEVEGLIGLFVNTLVLRTNLAGNPTFEEVLTRVREVALGAYVHQDLPFELLVEELQPQRDLSYAPLFQVMFVLQNAPMSDLKLPGMTLSTLAIESGSTKFDLTLEMAETTQGLFATLEYSTDLFEESTISRMAGHLQSLLQGIVANPQRRLSELPLLTEAEKHQLLVEWNDTKSEYPQEKCIHELFEAQVKETPDAVAVVFENEQLTYSELNKRANQLAHYLRTLGVKSEVLVGICVERSLSMVIGLLAILKAGGAYVPLDPAYPPERLAFILQDAQVSVLLTQQHLKENLPQHQTNIVCLDTDWEIIAQESQQNPISECTTDNLAYIIYTSGSTGQPKGVLVNHRNVVRLLAATESWYHFNQHDVWTLFHSIAFDFSVWELWGALLYGGKLVVVPYWVSRSPEDFYKLLLTQQVTILNQTPSAFSQLIQAEKSFGNTNKLSLRKVIFGGEALQLESLRPWFERHGDQFPQLVNMYGITETTVHVTYRPLTMKDLEVTSASVIGRPIGDLQVYLLDKFRQSVPIGVPGEMYIGGAGVVRGYLNRPELTPLRFIPNPFSNKPNARLYKSGDLGRYLPNGDIEYLGRIDHQVKVRGFRIELGEIEALISQYPAVRETVVVAADTQSLVAYVVPEKEQTLTITELRHFLGSKLPNYMVPTAFVMLSALPLTPNGKIDRKALPASDTARPQLEAIYQPPETDVEKTIADIWQEVLNIENVGIYDNFFELGGHSLLLVQVHSKLREVIQSDLSMLDLFRYPTINSLVDYFNQVKNGNPSFRVTNIVSEKIEAGKAQQKKRLQKMKSIENI